MAKTGQKRKSKLTSQQRVLKVIFKQHGGTGVVAKRLGLSFERVNNWILRGRVPLLWANIVSLELNVNIFLLNFEDVNFFFGREPDDWEDTAKTYLNSLETSVTFL